MISDLGGLAEALPAYDIQGELGRGGMGVVLSATQRALGRAVAIKQLPPAFAADPEIRARFESEARVLASLSHPHIVAVHDFVADGPCVLVMERLSGGSVWDRFKAVGLTPEAACAVVISTCAGLHHAHERKVLHRDVKPENVLFDERNVAKVCDFGIAKVIGGEVSRTTQGGDILGTPVYMAPEQALGEALTPATDVYAAGLMLYELLSGRLPFSQDGDGLAIAYRHVHEAPVDLHNVAPNVPVALVVVTMRAIDRIPARRYVTAEDFAVAIADAAAQSWGAGWLERSGIPMFLGERVLGASAGRGVSVVSIPTNPGLAESGWNLQMEAIPVRPTSPGHVRARPVDVLHPSELIDVQVALRRKRAPSKALPRLLLVGACVLALIAVVTTRPPSHSTALRSTLPGALRVNGAEVTAAHPTNLDLSHPVDVVVAAPVAAGDALALSFRALGLPLGRSSRIPVSASGSTLRAEIAAQSSRYVAGGRMLAVLELSNRGRVVASREFDVETKQGGFLTLAGAGVVILWLVLISYGEAIARATRRGKRKSSAVVVLAVVGGFLGASLPVVYELAGTGLATRSLAARGFVFGALAGLVAAIAFLLLARSDPKRTRGATR